MAPSSQDYQSRQASREEATMFQLSPKLLEPLEPSGLHAWQPLTRARRPLHSFFHSTCPNQTIEGSFLCNKRWGRKQPSCFLTCWNSSFTRSLVTELWRSIG